MASWIRNGAIWGVMFAGLVVIGAQQVPLTGAPATAAHEVRTVHLNVVVKAKSGSAVTGLGQQDFTLLDNKAVMAINSFKAVVKGQEPVEVIVLIDAVNSRFDTVAYERDQVQRFLKLNGGKLEYPTAIGVLSDKGVAMQKGFTTDGAALGTALDGYTSGLRQITRSAGIWGANEQVGISLNAIRELTGYAGKLPGRKIVIWISPGWALLSGPGIDLDMKQQQQIFGDIVSLSGALREANVTLYNINPLGVNESLGRADYFEEFTRGVSKLRDVQIGNLGLQVLAVQSGGLALESSSDVTGGVRTCLEDLDAWYEIGFEMPPTETPNIYHHVEVKVDKPGVTARTRDGYYAQP